MVNDTAGREAWVGEGDWTGRSITYAWGSTGQVVGSKINGNKVIGWNIANSENLPGWLVTQVPLFQPSVRIA